MLGAILLRSGLLFAQVDATKELEAMRDTAARNTSVKGPSMDLMIILGIGLCLSAILFFWAFFIRKRPRHTRGALVAQAGRHNEAHGSGGKRRRRKRRPEHPDNWGRNPTLGETGGLPPSRPDDPEAASSSSEPESPPAR
jgi:hypothetical protein